VDSELCLATFTCDAPAGIAPSLGITLLSLAISKGASTSWRSNSLRCAPSPTFTGQCATCTGIAESPELLANSSTLSQALMRSTAMRWNLREYRWISTNAAKVTNTHWARCRSISTSVSAVLSACPRAAAEDQSGGGRGAMRAAQDLLRGVERGI
jgi:hypothetical protein